MLFALLSFIGLLLLRVPISFVLGITTILYIILSNNMGLMASAPQRLYSGLESYGLLAIPLFMMAGELMNSGGITKRLVQFSKTVVGHFRGGLAYVNVLSNMLLASIIGSATAQIAMMSRTMVPSMEKEGYSREFSASTTATAGLLGPVIPPSMMFIIYGVTSGASIGSMFLAGVVPGILLALVIMILIALIGMKQKWPTYKRVSIGVMLNSFLRVIPALLIPIIIIAGILSGVFTPTESAAVASVVAAFVGFFVYRELKIKNIPSIMINMAISTATITLLIAMANLFGWMMSFEQIPQSMALWMTSLTENPLVFLLIVNLFLLIVGMFIDGLAALIILVPIFIPIIATYGIDPIHFGVIICINLTIGLLTPPLGAGLYIASSVGKVQLESLTKSIMPFLTVSIAALLVITFWPEMVLWLPGIFD